MTRYYFFLLDFGVDIVTLGPKSIEVRRLLDTWWSLQDSTSWKGDWFFIPLSFVLAGPIPEKVGIMFGLHQVDARSRATGVDIVTARSWVVLLVARLNQTALAGHSKPRSPFEMPSDVIFPFLAESSLFCC